jgi:glycosyltransferase involved in cell wall biosynthesis
MNASDIFLFSSKREGMPNVILEAMSSGLPVVAKRIPKITDIIIDGNNGIAVDNHDDFIKCIFEIINNEDLKNNYSKNARNTALTKFSSSVIMSEYINLYKNLSHNTFIIE